MSRPLVQQSIQMLGLRAKDKVTGFKGIVSSVSFDAYGCVQAVITPPIKDGKPQDGHWFDIKRLETSARVLDLPDFDVEAGKERGAAEKPRPAALPR